MGILASISPISAALNLATELVKSRGRAKAAAAEALLSPKQKADAFAQMLLERMGKAEGMAEHTMNLFDSDDDGKLTVSELGMGERKFAGLDSNGDGFVTKNELLAHYRGRITGQTGA